MKLSKNRLNKIKLKRNASRKKYKLRTQRGQYENSKKRYKRDTHLNRKTLKGLNFTKLGRFMNHGILPNL